LGAGEFLHDISTAIGLVAITLKVISSDRSALAFSQGWADEK